MSLNKHLLPFSRRSGNICMPNLGIIESYEIFMFFFLKESKVDTHAIEGTISQTKAQVIDDVTLALHKQVGIYIQTQNWLHIMLQKTLRLALTTETVYCTFSTLYILYIHTHSIYTASLSLHTYKYTQHIWPFYFANRVYLCLCVCRLMEGG